MKKLVYLLPLILFHSTIFCMIDMHEYTLPSFGSLVVVQHMPDLKKSSYSFGYFQKASSKNIVLKSDQSDQKEIAIKRNSVENIQTLTGKLITILYKIQQLHSDFINRDPKEKLVVNEDYTHEVSGKCEQNSYIPGHLRIESNGTIHHIPKDDIISLTQRILLPVDSMPSIGEL